ncbi:MAG: hypothetical protein U9R02_02205 [Thermodesulfobacteriota bacterium]|nr:hypothetical protein [Thermodesulfobacteriota bacterium]
MKKIFCIIPLLPLIIFAFSQQIFAANDSFTQKDRELLIRLDERLNQIDRRFQQQNKRIEDLRGDMNRRFEQQDKRIQDLREDMNKRFDFMLNIMVGIVTAFAAIVAVTIGFAIWDRRTMTRPFEDKVKKIESDIANDHEKLHNLITALKKLAKTDSRLAEVLKAFSLL